MYEKHNKILKCKSYVPPNVPPAEDRYPYIYQQFLYISMYKKPLFLGANFTACRNFEKFNIIIMRL